MKMTKITGINIIFFGVFVFAIWISLAGDNVCAIDVTANSCSAGDIQTAINNVVAGGGGTVFIPSCRADDTWTSNDAISVTTDVPFRLKGAGMDSTVIGYQDGTYLTKGMYFGGSGLIEISNFTFRGHKTDKGIPTGIQVYSGNTKNLRIHHLRLQQFENTGLYICQNPDSPMVIDHCEFGDQYNGMYGIRVTGCNTQSHFQIPALFGEKNPNAVFIENNTFNDTYHPTAAFGASNVVFRHNTVRNVTSWIDGHGPCYALGCNVGSIEPRSGTYIYEIYDNDIDMGSYGTCIGLRGGTGIVTDNILRGCKTYAIRLRVEGCSIGTNCNSADGCPHSTTDTTQCYQSPNQYWIWNNDYFGNEITANSIEHSDQNTGCIRENKEYYLRAPQAGDPVANYTKYQYPHPLVSGSENKIPVAYDTTVPSIPNNFSADTASSNRIDLSWQASTDDMGVTGYKIYRNMALVGTTTALVYSDTGLEPETIYTYAVSAYDAAGNESEQSEQVRAITRQEQDSSSIKTARSCSLADVQEAINQCNNNLRCRIVNVPAGSATWADNVEIPNLKHEISIIGAGISDTVLTLASDKGAFTLDSNTEHYYIRISGFRFNFPDQSTIPITIKHTADTGFRVDHCSFYGHASTGGMVGLKYVWRGVVDNCVFEDSNPGVNHPYGITLAGPSINSPTCTDYSSQACIDEWDSGWWDNSTKHDGQDFDENYVPGTDDAIFIEANEFKNVRSSVMWNWASKGAVVVRYNLFRSSNSTASPLVSAKPGSIWIDVYNNEIYWEGEGRGAVPHTIRPSGTIHNNSYNNLLRAGTIEPMSGYSYSNLWTPQTQMDELYIWDNKYNNCKYSGDSECTENSAGNCGWKFVSSYNDGGAPYKYFFRKPAIVAGDRFNYTTYTCPHPLTGFTGTCDSNIIGIKGYNVSSDVNTSNGNSNAKNKKLCVISTSSFFSESVITGLKKVRDLFLINSSIGKKIINKYYKLSPIN